MVFLIITVVQFIVIAKGAERVAEVAARFTLDAMPGKQMSIDADLRAGPIDADEARRRRARSTRESQLFGAMDGAMKFVKGDAIAGIIILAVNIVGGLVIGVLQRGHGRRRRGAPSTDPHHRRRPGRADPGAARSSTAAGIIVTRVASEEQDDGAGEPPRQEIARQLLAQPKALAIAAGLLALLAIVPGLPALPFLALAAALGAVAWRLLRAPATAGAATSEADAAGASDAAGAADAEGAVPSPVLTPIAVEVSPSSPRPWARPTPGARASS